MLSPASCALAVALPLSEDAFLRDAADPGKDFARSAIARSQRTPAAAWREIYAPKVVRLYERIAAHARGLGATVVPGVTAAMLRELLEAFPLVSLFAHSMSPPIVSADVAAPRAILDAVRAGETIVARHLRETFANRTWASDEATLASQVAAALDAALALTRAWTETAVRSERAGRPARLLGRVMLEDSFG
ncbi:MAG TPA: hypothetical protein VFP84_37190, partial [Kofleriaceae bacterium]|nr:hypothetical protein [Kofleriaceae bacterium]